MSLNGKQLSVENFNEIIEWADRYNIPEEKLPRDIEKIENLRELYINGWECVADKRCSRLYR